jgi:carbon starvation protein
LFGIANQMLAAIALTLATVVFAKSGRNVLVALGPLVWLLVCTLTAAGQKLFDANPKISFLAHANIIRTALAEDRLVAPAKTMAQMHQLLVYDMVNAAMCALFAGVVVAIAVFGVRAVRNRLPLTDLSAAPVRA